MIQTLELENKCVTLIPAAAGSPLVVLHTFEDEGLTVYELARAATTVPFAFAAIGGIDWNNEMTPWPSPSPLRDDAPYAGRAADYLATLTAGILPQLIARLEAPPSTVALTGYSLAGLFALYAMYRTDCCQRFASVSGSLWYPGFVTYAREHTPVRRPERIYLSYGDREAKTKNTTLQTVADNTDRLAEWYRGQGIDTILEQNPGNHFRRCHERMARGIVRLLQPE